VLLLVRRLRAFVTPVVTGPPFLRASVGGLCPPVIGYAPVAYMLAEQPSVKEPSVKEPPIGEDLTKNPSVFIRVVHDCPHSKLSVLFLAKHPQLFPHAHRPLLLEAIGRVIIQYET